MMRNDMNQGESKIVDQEGGEQVSECFKLGIGIG